MSIWSKVLEVVQNEWGVHYNYPDKPFLCRIPGGLADGRKLYVHGFLPPDCKRFAVNLLAGSDPSADTIAFHVNPRFDEKDIVMNNRVSDEWGIEQRSSSIPLRRMAPFLLCITTLQNGYELEINDKWVATFDHRLPFDTVKNVHVEGDVDIHGVHILGKEVCKDGLFPIPGGVQPSQTFIIDGKCLKEFSGFSVNFQCGEKDDDDIAFHFNPRRDSQLVVRNSYISGSWGDEEREGDSPFNAGERFLMKVVVLADGFDVSINGDHFTKYEHRLPISKVSTLTVQGDGKVRDLKVEMPHDARKHADYCKAEVHDPSTPAKVQVSGFQPGSFLSVAGIVKQDAERFKINLQSGPDDDTDDVMLHVNPRWDEGDPKIVLNSREGGSWADEEMWQGEFPLEKGARFEIIIECEEGGYRIEMNGNDHQFKHRVDNDKVKYVFVDGDVDLKRIVAA